MKNAIYYCHKNWIVHRDLKSESLFLYKSENLSIKVIDFGIIKKINPEKFINEKVGSAYYILLYKSRSSWRKIWGIMWYKEWWSYIIYNNLWLSLF